MISAAKINRDVYFWVIDFPSKLAIFLVELCFFQALIGRGSTCSHRRIISWLSSFSSCWLFWFSTLIAFLWCFRNHSWSFRAHALGFGCCLLGIRFLFRIAFVCWNSIASVLRLFSARFLGCLNRIAFCPRLSDLTSLMWRTGFWCFWFIAKV